MKIVSIVLVLVLFGTVCSSYAIDCMDVWDEESIAEMIEDDRQYEESLKAQSHDQHEEEEDDAEHPVDSEDAIVADTDEEDEDDANHQGQAHEAQEQRHKRESPVDEQLGIQGQAIVEEPSDLETAETHLFRPVFRYKSQYTERRRVRTPNGGVNFAPSQ